MRSAIFLSHDPGFVGVVTEVLVARGGRVLGESVQLVEDGPGRGLFNWDGPYPAEADWEFRKTPCERADGVELPDMATVDAYYVECRWEQQFAEIARAIAEASPQPVWVMDSYNVVWDAAAIDPDRIRL